MKPIRLQKYIAECGITSRRKAEDLIKSGKVSVNGKKITELTYKVIPDKDKIKVNGKLIKKRKKIYIVLNKPKKVISSVKDEKGRKTVVDIIKGINKRIYPVGRLDYNTTGCIFLTNDGEWANKIIHPRYKIEKEYIVKVKGKVTSNEIERLKKGIFIDKKIIKAKEVSVIKRNEKNDILKIIITEGINHQIKKMINAIGKDVINLKRKRVGIVDTDGLDVGEWRFLSEKEIKFFSKEDKK